MLDAAGQQRFAEVAAGIPFTVADGELAPGLGGFQRLIRRFGNLQELFVSVNGLLPTPLDEIGAAEGIENPGMHGRRQWGFEHAAENSFGRSPIPALFKGQNAPAIPGPVPGMGVSGCGFFQLCQEAVAKGQFSEIDGLEKLCDQIVDG